MTPLRELQLVERYRQGGAGAHDALCELIRGYQRRIFSICFRMVRHTDDASDLTQDVLVKIIESLGSYNGQSKLSTWVIRIAINCCLSHLRKQKLRSHESIEGGLSGRGGSPGTPSGDQTFAAGGLGHASGAEPLPQLRVEQAQARTAVLQAFDSLDIDSRTILLLRDLQDLDYQQLAEVLEVPIGTVKSRLFRARAALRTAVEAQGDH